MYHTLTSTKINNSTHLVKNKLTNEPIAFLKNAGSYSNVRSVNVEWHPTYKAIHPEVQDSILDRNFSSSYDSASAAVSSLEYKTRDHLEGKYVKDPVKTKYAGIHDISGNAGITKVHRWSIQDDDGKHIAHIQTVQPPDKLHKDHDVSLIWNSEFHKTIPESVLEAAKKKHSSSKLGSTLYRVKYILDNKNKEPRFIGSFKDEKGVSKVYKHKLSPEEASKAFEEHLKNTLDNKHVFTRHSQTVFSALKPAEEKYSSSYHHHIISMPGEIHHIVSKYQHPDYEYRTDRNNHIIESKISLENLIETYNFVEYKNVNIHPVHFRINSFRKSN